VPRAQATPDAVWTRQLEVGMLWMPRRGRNTGCQSARLNPRPKRSARYEAGGRHALGRNVACCQGQLLMVQKIGSHYGT